MATKKFKAATHFVINECRDDPAKLGATRLNKALWNADVLAFKKTGKSITNDKYLKRQNGPVPCHILSTISELTETGALITREPEYQYDTRKFVSLKDPALSSLTSDEQNFLKAAISFVCGKTADTVSDLTHDIVWDAAAIGEEIPMFATLASTEGEVTDEVLSWADACITDGNI